MFKKSYFFFFEPFLGGLLFPWGFLLKGIPSFFPAPTIGLLLLVYRLSLFKSEKRLRDDFLRILFYLFGVWALGYSWIPYTLSEFGGLFFPFNYLLGLLAVIVILPQLFVLPFFSYLKKKIPFPLPWPLAFAGLMVLSEEFFPQLFPSHFGQAWLNLAPYIGLAPYFGASIFSLFSFWIVFELAQSLQEKKFSKFFLVPLAVFLILNFSFPLTFPKQTLENLNIRLVQANIGNYIKVASEKGSAGAIMNVVKSYADLSLAPSSEKIDLILWPETAYPYTVESENWRMNSRDLPPFLKKIAEGQKADFFLGGYEWAQAHSPSDFETTYNAAFHFSYNENGQVEFKDVYRKMRLIPFGETLPFGPLNSYLGKLITNISYFKQGESFTLFETKKKARFISIICYEALFSSFVRDYLRAVSKPPHFIVNLTNDSWYGHTNEPYEHLFLTKWRAVEFNLPLVRMTNTGISTVIFPDGSESARLGYDDKNFLDIKLPLVERKPTFYERFGLWGTFGIWLFLLGLSVLWRNLRAKGRASV